jgi:hypothetical protein
MNREEIIAIARQHTVGGLEFDWDGLVTFFNEAYAAGAAAEREACIQVCEDNADDYSEGEWDSACISCADHIRARRQA